MNFRILTFLLVVLFASTSFAGTKKDNVNDYIFGKSVTVSNPIILAPRLATPAAIKGGIYYDSVNNTYMGSTNGTDWLILGELTKNPTGNWNLAYVTANWASNAMSTASTNWSYYPAVSSIVSRVWDNTNSEHGPILDFIRSGGTKDAPEEPESAVPGYFDGDLLGQWNFGGWTFDGSYYMTSSIVEARAQGYMGWDGTSDLIFKTRNLSYLTASPLTEKLRISDSVRLSTSMDMQSNTLYAGPISLQGNSITSGNQLLVGLLTTNYTVNIPTSWSIQDIYNAAASIPSTIIGGQITFDWDDGVHSYGNDMLNIDRILGLYTCPFIKDTTGSTTNTPIKFVGNPENPTACKLQFGPATPAVTAIWANGSKIYSCMNGFTVEMTNSTRTTQGIVVGNGGRFDVLNTVVSNASYGFVSRWTALCLVTNCIAINCNYGFYAIDAILYGAGKTIATNCSVGYISSWGGFIKGLATTEANACTTAYQADFNGYMDIQGSKAVGASVGYYATSGGKIQAATSTSTGCTLDSNPYFDSYNSDGSGIYKYGSGQFIYMPTPYSWSHIQTLIDSLGQNLNNNQYFLVCSGIVYTCSTPLSIGGKNNGFVRIDGSNYNSYANSTNQITVFDTTGVVPKYNINIGTNTAFVSVRGIKHQLAYQVTGIYVTYQYGPVVIANCSFIGTNSTANGVNALRNSSPVRIQYCVGASLSTLVYADSTTIHMFESQTTNRTPICSYAGTAQNMAIIQVSNANTNYPAVTRWAIATGGLIVTNVGKILP